MGIRPTPSKKFRRDDEPSPSELRAMRERGEWDEDDDIDDVPVKKAPLLYRLIAWIALLLLFFGGGYGAMSVMFKWMDSGGVKTPDNLAASQQEVADMLAKAKSADAEAISKNAVTCTLSIPDNGTFVSRQIQCSAGLREDTMKQTIAAFLDAVKENSLIDPASQNLNLFQSGDHLYLNMNQKFFDSLKKQGKDGSRFIITGIVRTMSNNFSPISKVKFYIEGKEAGDKSVVDLSSAWSL